MKRIRRSTIAAALALCMLLLVLPTLAQPSALYEAGAQPYWSVPEGYNENDYNRCAAFLEQTDENGVKNGERLIEGYDVNDPVSWGEFNFQWAERDGLKRLVTVSLWQATGLTGSLDLSGCGALVSLDVMGNSISSIGVSGCSALLYLDCSDNRITELEVSDCTELIYLYCDNNGLSEIDVSALHALEEFDCFNNDLTHIDVSGCPALEAFYCMGNPLTQLDLSQNPILGYDRIAAEGSGYIGYKYLIDVGEVHALPTDGAEFIGFFDENGTLIDEGYFDEDADAFVLSFGSPAEGAVYARFSGGSPAVPGDIDSNGEVTVSDAVTALRLAMQLIDEAGLDTDSADMDGNGSVTISDAVVILRLAMGLI